MELKKTPLCDWHIAHKAKMGPFASWNMPIQYPTGIIAEHIHTRTKASVFDICHMGQGTVEGEGITEALEKAVTHNLETLKPGKCRYGFLLNEKGTVSDDLIIYRLAQEKYFLVVNAACVESDFKTIEERIAPFTVNDVTQQYGKIDLQGPLSINVLEKVTQNDFHDLPYFSFRNITWEGEEVLVSRTGYTGELGYEIYPPRDMTPVFWEELVACEEVIPAGLGARDTLRLEAGLPLYGHELDSSHTPTEAGMGAMLTSKANYVGKKLAQEGVRQVLIGLQAEGKRAARAGDKILLVYDQNKEVGVVTSGSYAPSIDASVAFAYVDVEFANQNEYLMKAAKTTIHAKRTDPPFYKYGTARKKFE